MEISQSNLHDFVEAYMNNVSDDSDLTYGNVAPIAIDILDKDGRVCYANQKCIDLFGFEEDKVLTYKLTDLAVHEKHVKELDQHIKWLVTEKPYPTPYIGLNKTLQGEVIHVRVHWDYIFHEGEVIGFFSVITNLSEKVPSLERYRANEVIVNAMIQTMLCGVMILGAAGEILEVNNLCTQILGGKRDEILGCTISDLLTPVKATKDLTGADFSSIPKALVNEYRLNKRVNNCRRYILLESASALLYKSVSSLIVFVKDVTQERMESHALAVKKRELEQHYRQTLLTEMISGLAHEINQPLAAITNYTKGCMRRLEGHHADPEILQTLDMVVRQANRASNIIQHMRQWDEGNRESYAEVDLKELINGSIRLLEFDLHEAKIKLDQQIVLNCPAIFGCQIELEQVFINLMRNSIEAINLKSKVGVNILKKMSIEVQPSSPDMIDIIVRDSGIGISIQDAEHVFEPFFTTKNDGMGIGLALSEKIIQDHNGYLRYSSCDGDYSTTFTISLPIYVKPGKKETTRVLQEMTDYSSKVWVSL